MAKAAEIEARLIKNGEMLSLADLLIAFSAITYSLMLITGNIRHFRRILKSEIKMKAKSC